MFLQRFRSHFEDIFIDNQIDRLSKEIKYQKLEVLIVNLVISFQLVVFSHFDS